MSFMDENNFLFTVCLVESITDVRCGVSMKADMHLSCVFSFPVSTTSKHFLDITEAHCHTNIITNIRTCVLGKTFHQIKA